MRIRRVLAIALLVTLAATGCGKAKDDGNRVATLGKGASPGGSSAPAGRGNEQEQLLKYAKCMRENGVPNFPDPKPAENGESTLDLPESVDPAAVDAAQKQCKQLLPNGGEPVKVDPETLEKMTKYAECMRANGVPKFPDPGPNGFQINGNELGMGPNDPTFDAADSKCKQYMPAGPGGSTQNKSNG
jgi:hypothetical protein